MKTGNTTPQKNEEKRTSCLYCGKPLSGQQKKFCSRNCCKYWNRAAKAARSGSAPVVQQELWGVCPVCGTRFRLHSKDQRYCSSICFAREARRRTETRTPLLLRITTEIPVDQHMRPREDRLYRGERLQRSGERPILLIPEIGDFGLIVYPDEVEILAEG